MLNNFASSIIDLQKLNFYNFSIFNLNSHQILNCKNIFRDKMSNTDQDQGEFVGGESYANVIGGA
jgi:hypothetical protein